MLNGKTISEIINGTAPSSPYLEVKSIKEVAFKNNTKPIYQFELFDGDMCYPRAMLNPKSNELVSTARIETNSVIKLKDYSLYNFGEKKFLAILDLEVGQSTHIRL